MNTVLLITTMAASLLSYTIMKYLAENYEDGTIANHFFNMIASFSAAGTLFLIARNLHASLFTIILGIVFGLTTAIQKITYLQALQVGPFSYTAVIVSLSMLIPTLSGAVIWGEQIHAIQVVGIVLMSGCLVLSVDFKSEEKKSSLKWLLFCATSFFCAGIIGIMQKWHQGTVYKDELNQFLVIAFLAAAVYSAVSIIVAKKTSDTLSTAEDGGSKKKLTHAVPVIIIAVCGIGNAVNNLLNLYLSGVMDSAVFFPVINGGGLILTTLCALLVFKEKLSARKWAGILLGIVAVILLCNP